jgi:hypothetical protein
MYTPQERTIANRFFEDTNTFNAPPGNETLERLKKRLTSVKVDGETFYIAEGDLLLDEDELLVYALQRQARDMQRLIGTTALTDRSGELLGIVVGGKLVRWQIGLTLSYCVLKRSFTSASEYEIVKRNVSQATADWERVCGIKFEHKRELDDSPINPSPAGVIFSVRQLDSGGRFIASAFFPNDPPERRRVLIDPSYFTTGFDQVGVLRHELGHVLGCRHEHIRSGAPADCPDESTVSTFPFTAYDPKSVMHYFCGQVGTRELAISDLDKVGIQKLYGPPLEDFRFVE